MTAYISTWGRFRDPIESLDWLQSQKFYHVWLCGFSHRSSIMSESVASVAEVLSFMSDSVVSVTEVLSFMSESVASVAEVLSFMSESVASVTEVLSCLSLWLQSQKFYRSCLTLWLQSQKFYHVWVCGFSRRSSIVYVWLCGFSHRWCVTSVADTLPSCEGVCNFATRCLEMKASKSILLRRLACFLLSVFFLSYIALTVELLILGLHEITFSSAVIWPEYCTKKVLVISKDSRILSPNHTPKEVALESQTETYYIKNLPAKTDLQTRLKLIVPSGE